MTAVQEWAERRALNLAELEHAEKCARPSLCADGWHVRNDYLPRHRRAVAADLTAAAHAMSRDT